MSYERNIEKEREKERKKESKKERKREREREREKYSVLIWNFIDFVEGGWGGGLVKGGVSIRC